jgi:CheY-like chemotaxis protein
VQTRILFVDDEPTIANTLAIIARAHGYDSKAAFSGKQALTILSEFTPDILVTDYSMPGENGLELASQVARECPGCRLFLLTAYADTDSFQRPSRSPKVTVLSKPMGPAELLKSIEGPVDASWGLKTLVLNVDDKAPNRYSITRLLVHHGFEVVEAENGSDALAKLAQSPYDAVLLDINMPDIDGFEVCRRIRKDAKYKRLTIMHFTGTYNNTDAENLSRAVLADGFLSQPVEPAELVARLRGLIQRNITQ